MMGYRPAYIFGLICASALIGFHLLTTFMNQTYMATFDIKYSRTKTQSLDQLNKLGAYQEIITNPVNSHTLCTERFRSFHVIVPDCQKLFHVNASNEDQTVAEHWTEPKYTDHDMAELVKGCSSFRKQFWFPDKPMTPAERDYPLAYTIIVHTRAEQVVRLLQATYWPQNLYCIHIDKKSNRNFRNAIQGVARCLGTNVFFTKSVAVKWGQPSVLQAAVNCLKDLDEHPSQWRYAQIISGNDFPLRTNAELVRIYTILNGSNDLELADIGTGRHIFNKNKSSLTSKAKFLRIAPHGVTLYKSSFQSSLSREFVTFMRTDYRAADILNYLLKTRVPDETYWATLNYNIHLNVSGNFPGACWKHYRAAKHAKVYISRHQIWKWNRQSQCRSNKWRAGSCVFGVKDLPNLAASKALSAHKFYDTFQPATLYCLAERHFNRTFSYPHHVAQNFNSAYYESLPAVQYHKLIDKTVFNCF